MIGTERIPRTEKAIRKNHLRMYFWMQRHRPQHCSARSLAEATRIHPDRKMIPSDQTTPDSQKMVQIRCDRWWNLSGRRTMTAHCGWLQQSLHPSPSNPEKKLGSAWLTTLPPQREPPERHAVHAQKWTATPVSMQNATWAVWRLAGRKLIRMTARWVNRSWFGSRCGGGEALESSTDHIIPAALLSRAQWRMVISLTAGEASIAVQGQPC